MPKETSPALTVDQLRERLDEISQAGGGASPVLLPYDPGHATIGGSPTRPLTGVNVGFDWDQGKVLLAIPERVGIIDAELRKRADRVDNALGRLLLAINRLDPDGNFSLEDQVNQLKEMARVTVERAHNRIPKAPR